MYTFSIFKLMDLCCNYWNVYKFYIHMLTYIVSNCIWLSGWIKWMNEWKGAGKTGVTRTLSRACVSDSDYGGRTTAVFVVRHILDLGGASGLSLGTTTRGPVGQHRSRFFDLPTPGVTARTHLSNSWNSSPSAKAFLTWTAMTTDGPTWCITP
jgi:hypothetical protein